MDAIFGVFLRFTASSLRDESLSMHKTYVIIYDSHQKFAQFETAFSQKKYLKSCTEPLSHVENSEKCNDYLSNFLCFLKHIFYPYKKEAQQM